MNGTSNKYKVIFIAISVSIVLTLALTLTIVIPVIMRIYVVQAFKIPAASMMPTLMVGDHILVDKTKQARESAKKGDLIIFRFPKDREKIFVKRIIAVGGDKIESKDKNIYINGVLIEEPYVQHVEKNIISEAVNPRDNFGPYVVPENKIFVMGDNRDQSNDSRYWGYVSKEDVLGKVLKIYWSWDIVNNTVRWERVGKAV